MQGAARRRRAGALGRYSAETVKRAETWKGPETAVTV
jgi:hypothetical protein